MRELVRFAPVLASGLDDDSRSRAVAGLRAALGGARPAVQEAVLAALAQIDRGAATSAAFALFARLDGRTDGLAARLLARLAAAAPTTARCLAALTGDDDLTGILAAEALGEQGPVAVEPLLTRLRPLLGPGRAAAEDRVRRRIAYALWRVGPGAAAAIPALIDLLADETAYRDTRWYAKQALAAIGPAAAQALVDELRAAPRWPILEALAQLPVEALTRATDLAPLLLGLRRGDDPRLHGLSEALLHRMR